MNLTSSLTLGNTPPHLAPSAQPNRPYILQNGTVLPPIGAIGAVTLDHHLSVTSTSVDTLLAVADAFQEAARLLRAAQIDERISAAVA